MAATERASLDRATPPVNTASICNPRRRGRAQTRTRADEDARRRGRGEGVAGQGNTSSQHRLNLQPTQTRTHLTSASIQDRGELEQQHGHGKKEEFIDVTLNSLLSESLDLLETMEMLNTFKSFSAAFSAVLDDEASEQTALQSRALAQTSLARNRGMPYFEELIEHSAPTRLQAKESAMENGR